MVVKGDGDGDMVTMTTTAMVTVMAMVMIMHDHAGYILYGHDHGGSCKGLFASVLC